MWHGAKGVKTVLGQVTNAGGMLKAPSFAQTFIAATRRAL